MLWWNEVFEAIQSLQCCVLYFNCFHAIHRPAVGLHMHRMLLLPVDWTKPASGKVAPKPLSLANWPQQVGEGEVVLPLHMLPLCCHSLITGYFHH
jgi:hypothetical protein